jgi:hypothetical protein
VGQVTRSSSRRRTELKLKHKVGDGPKPKPGRMHSDVRKQLKKGPKSDSQAEMLFFTTSQMERICLLPPNIMESTHSICGQASLSPVIMLARNYLCGVIGLLIRVTQIFGDSISRLMVFGIWRHVIHAIRVYNAGANDRNPHRRL